MNRFAAALAMSAFLVPMALAQPAFADDYDRGGPPGQPGQHDDHARPNPGDYGRGNRDPQAQAPNPGQPQRGPNPPPMQDQQRFDAQRRTNNDPRGQNGGPPMRRDDNHDDRGNWNHDGDHDRRDAWRGDRRPDGNRDDWRGDHRSYNTRDSRDWRGWHSDRDIREFRARDFGSWRGGHWYHGSHGGRSGWWWIVGSIFYPYQYRTAAMPDPYVPQEVLQSGQYRPGYWYFCNDPEGYYPYVAECFSPWHAVPQ